MRGAATTAELDKLHTLVEARLRRVELRYTHGRRAIIDLMTAARRPLSINDIAAGLPQLPRSSAYRHLVDLQTAGVVRRIAAADEYARYEIDEPLRQHHHHLICTNCGNVVDVTPTPAFERSIHRQFDRLAASHGFTSDSHVLDAFGTCAGCRQPQPPRSNRWTTP